MGGQGASNLAMIESNTIAVCVGALTNFVTVGPNLYYNNSTEVSIAANANKTTNEGRQVEYMRHH